MMTNWFLHRELTDQGMNRGLICCRCRLLAIGLLSLLSLFWFDNLSVAQSIPTPKPATVRMSEKRLDRIAAIVARGIQEQKMPGCTVCVGRHGKIIYLKAFGHKQLEPAKHPMTTDTVFDLASLTKPVATATSIMQLVESSELALDDPVARYLPEFGVKGKDAITIMQLLTHQSGLIPDNALKDYLQGPEVAWKKICELGLVAPVGTKFQYSDVNFIVLGKLIESISGQDLHQYTQQNLFHPLGMRETGFLPSEALRVRAAPTEQRDGKWIKGVVHDPRAFHLGGIAGHAGLFSTASDLAIYADAMLNQGTRRETGSNEANSEKLNPKEAALAEPKNKKAKSPVRILQPRTVELMTQAVAVSSGTRGLGWDKQSAYSSNRGQFLSASSYGHGGFTGTVLWLDPERDLFFIFLSNRVHPNGIGSINRIAGQIADVVATSVLDRPSSVPNAPGVVKLGIDVLIERDFQILHNQRVGLITNQTGRTSDGRATIDALHKSSRVDLVALFSPEHGIRGQLDQATILDTVDPATGLSIYSLYGKTKRPTAKMLNQVDVLVFDIQDVGTRFYTYVSTMFEAMQAAAESGKRFVVLDRPNPLGGEIVSGPMLDPQRESFVGIHVMPVRHGMTIGEVARMLNEERQLGLDLTVIPCQGWQRKQLWDETNLLWTRPSPNLRSLTQAILYPGIGLLEMTNVSMGRGTDTPFEIIGAPWMESRPLAAFLNAREIPGVTFVPIEFTPRSSKYQNQTCQGVNVILTDRQTARPTRIGLEIAQALRTMYPIDWQTQHLDRLLGNRQVFQAIVNRESMTKILKAASAGVDQFRNTRRAYLLYR